MSHCLYCHIRQLRQNRITKPHPSTNDDEEKEFMTWTTTMSRKSLEQQSSLRSRISGGKQVEKRTLTTGEIAHYCGVNFRTVIRWIKRGYLNAFQLPGRGDNRVEVGDFLAFLERHNIPIPEELQDKQTASDPASNGK
jgi:excisionase family DNA binding protein